MKLQINNHIWEMEDWQVQVLAKALACQTLKDMRTCDFLIEMLQAVGYAEHIKFKKVMYVTTHEEEMKWVKEKNARLEEHTKHTRERR